MKQTIHAIDLQRLRKMRRAITDVGFVIGADVCYDGSSIVIRCNSHSGAIRRMADARAGLAALEEIYSAEVTSEQSAPKSATPDENISPQTWPDNLLQHPEN